MSTPQVTGADPEGPVLTFLTAAHAYPEFERLILSAKREVLAGFRVFDLHTRLRSDEGRAIGEDWFDLLVHTLARGVTVRLILTDFDPVVRPAAHRMTWRSYRRFAAAAEASGHPENLKVFPAMHPARIGMGASVLLWPKAMQLIRHETRRLNGLNEHAAAEDLMALPGLRPHITGDHPNFRPRWLSLPRLVPTTHHQKVAVIDGATAYIGGLDLNERRYDTPDHERPGSETWHDCQIILRGDAAREAHQHLDTLTDVVAERRKPPALTHLMRTLSGGRNAHPFSLSPNPLVAEIENAHLAAIQSAQKLIYLETQFFRSLPLARALVRAARANPYLQLVLVLPGAPEDVAFEGSTSSDARYGEYLQAKCVEMVDAAFGDRFLVVSPARPTHDPRSDRGALYSAPLIYVHAKVSIFDDRTAMISSANLNGRSLRWDTEVGVALTRPEDVADLRDSCIRHWMPEDATVPADQLVETWRALARQNANTPPGDRDGFLLPYPVAPARRFGRNLPGIPQEMT